MVAESESDKSDGSGGLEDATVQYPRVSLFQPQHGSENLALNVLSNRPSLCNLLLEGG